MSDLAAAESARVAPLIPRTKPRSDVSFPYFSLDRSIEVPKVIHERAGGHCGREQLAVLLGYSGVKNGGFLTRMSAAKMYGLIEEVSDTITLTERSKKILSPIHANDVEQGKLDAYMAVELYRRVFEDFNGQSLPALDGMRNLFLTRYKVVPNQVAPALRNLMESADSAGLFKVAGTRTKLILPFIRNDTGGPASSPLPPAASELRDEGVAAVARPMSVPRTSAAPDLAGVHPALAGLIQNLPPIGSTLGPKRRAALIDAFKHTINFIYPEEEE